MAQVKRGGGGEGRGGGGRDSTSDVLLTFFLSYSCLSSVSL